MAIPLPLLDTPAPKVSLGHLDQLWFQVAGTVCNLTCHHCFISCSPHNHSFGLLRLDQVRAALDESLALGVKEYYFTGGEPFLNRDLVPMLELTLQYGPATVLTNGTVFTNDGLSRLRAADDASPFSLEFRVSIDGAVASTNDAIRGPGTFERAMHGVRQLVDAGFLPIVTAAIMDDANPGQVFDSFVAALRAIGCDRPRVKLLPPLRLGAEIARHRGYVSEERVSPEMMEGFDVGQLLCSHARIVTDRGVAVCPILIEAPDAHFGPTLTSAMQPFALRYHACSTCYRYGSICANPTGGEQGTPRWHETTVA